MTISLLAEKLGAEIINMPYPDREPCGAYCGDLLSWVMGHAQSDNIWVTIMTNKNVLAVAQLIDMSCVIISENAQLDNDFLETAKAKEINIIRSELDNYTVCAELSKLINE